VNARAEELFGYHRSELILKTVEMLLPAELQGIHITHRQNFWKDPRPRWMGDGRPLPAVTKDGYQFEAHIMLAPLIIAQGRFLITVLRKKES
jgi:protein-histidine pros-kinase